MERVDQPAPVGTSELVPSLAPVELAPHGTFLELATRARALPGDAGREAVEAVQRALTLLRADEAQVRGLLDALESGALNDLDGTDGVPLRARAITAVLALGYPFALHVAPEDLLWYRAWQKRPSERRLLILLGILAAELGAILGFGLWP